MHDLEVSLFISVCDLLKSFRVMKKTKASKDFGLQTGPETLPLKIPLYMIIRDSEADGNERIRFILK